MAEEAVRVDGAATGAATWRRWLRLAPFALAAAILAVVAIGRVLEKVGHPAAALDDAYIHFQYARAIAEGHPLRYQAGEPPTSGATSLLWPLLLAPFYALGFRDEAILWPAWALSFTALGALAWEAAALTERLAGRAAAAGAAAMVLALSAFTWCAGSGMEVVPFAWALARTARRASEWIERPADRSPGRARELVALAWVAPLLRPEGAVASAIAAAALSFARAAPGRSAWRSRLPAALAIAGIAATPIVLLVLTGSAVSNTAAVKLLVGNPYYRGAALARAIVDNARLLVGTLLDGRVYSAEFLPTGGAPIAIAGLVAIAACGHRSGARWRAAFVLAVALGMFAPCAYVTFLWNRLRYLWPFATGWIVGVACLTRLAGDAAAALRPRWRVVGPIASGVVAGALATHLDWTIDDLAQSASGIDRQQAALGRWAKERLAPDARIGVNDTGAIAYFGDRRTFDVVGLTTPDEGRYWVAGAGSRLEHYERLRAREPSRLPTHFIVYPEWMACDAVLGAPLFEATVTDASILGGRTMRAYVADYARLGSGERPWTSSGEAIDAVDVADLESEAAHAYALLGARDGEEVATLAEAPDGRVVVDGGRTQRTVERFVARLRDGAAARAIVRLEAAFPARVSLRAAGRALDAVDVAPGEWTEIAFDVPADVARASTPFELRADGAPVTVYHYWLVPPEEPR